MRLLPLLVLVACATPHRADEPKITPPKGEYYLKIKDVIGARWTQRIQEEALNHDPTGTLYSYRDRRTVVSFTLSRDGRVTGAALRESSGVKYIDDVAISVFSGLSLPPPPAAVLKDQETLRLPFAFTLQAVTRRR